MKRSLKKSKLDFKLIIFGIFILYFQILFSSGLSFMGVVPNFLIGYVVFLNIKFDLNLALFISFVIGLSYDLLNPFLLGFNALSFILITFFVNNYHKSIAKNKIFSLSLGLAFIVLVYFLPFILNNLITFNVKAQNLNNTTYWLIIFIKYIYNLIIAHIIICLFVILDKIKVEIEF